jgi:hypothetical protein
MADLRQSRWRGEGVGRPKVVRSDQTEMLTSVVGSPQSVRVPVDAIQPGETLRLGRVNEGYLDAIVELRGTWEPLSVTQDLQVIDGHYRLLAARRLAYTSVECVIFIGDDCDAFVEGVRQNTCHGLPLTLPERKNAAIRILAFRDGWSDRRIAELCGLAHDTVGRLRRERACQSGGPRHLDSQRDGNRSSRHTRESDARARIAQAIKETPSASLRQLARATGSSHETVRAVRRRLQSAPERTADLSPGDRRIPGKRAVSPSTDVAFTSTAPGASFAEWFERTAVGTDWVDYVDSVPLSRVYEIVDDAHRRAAAWANFAAALTARVAPD